MKITAILPIIIQEQWQVHMTDCCIKTMRDTTKVPFEITVVEAETNYYKNNPSVNTYIHHPKRLGYNTEFNDAIDKADDGYIVHIGNDIFTRPGWLEALLECFRFHDCGAATLASSDLKHQPKDLIMEGLYFPLMMLKKKDFKFNDKEFSGVFGDADLLMIIYNKGKRMFRNWNVVVQHLNNQSNGGVFDVAKKEKEFNEAKQRFIDKHKGSPYLVYRALVEGWIV